MKITTLATSKTHHMYSSPLLFTSVHIHNEYVTELAFSPGLELRSREFPSRLHHTLCDLPFLDCLQGERRKEGDQRREGGREVGEEVRKRGEGGEGKHHESQKFH